MNNTNAVNLSFDSSYFPKNGGLGDQEWYCDTSEIICPGTYTVSAVSFWEKMNRIAVKIGYYNNGTLNWVENSDNNESYWRISEDETYGTTSPVFVPENKVFRGLRLIQNGNQLGYEIYVSNPDGTKGEWINSSNDHYIEGSLKDIYADANEVVLSQGSVPVGFQVWQKGNRMAPSLIISRTK